MYLRATEINKSFHGVLLRTVRCYGVERDLYRYVGDEMLWEPVTWKVAIDGGTNVRGL